MNFQTETYLADTPTKIVRQTLDDFENLYFKVNPGHPADLFHGVFPLSLPMGGAEAAERMAPAPTHQMDTKKICGHFDTLTAVGLLCGAMCDYAIKAEEAGILPTAWSKAAQAQRYVALLRGAYVCFEQGNASVASDGSDELHLQPVSMLGGNVESIARAGGLARSARYQPLRDLARQLAQAGTYKSKRQAVLSIRPKILEAGEAQGVRLSSAQAEKTIGDWLSGIPFGSKRSR